MRFRSRRCLEQLPAPSPSHTRTSRERSPMETPLRAYSLQLDVLNDFCAPSPDVTKKLTGGFALKKELYKFHCVKERLGQERRKAGRRCSSRGRTCIVLLALKLMGGGIQVNLHLPSTPPPSSHAPPSLSLLFSGFSHVVEAQFSHHRSPPTPLSLPV